MTIFWIVLTIVLLSLFIFGLGWMACGAHVKKDYFEHDEEGKKKFGKYMELYWISEPTAGNFIYFIWFVLIAGILIIAAVNNYRNDILKKYDKGDIVKVVTYTSTEKPGEAPVRDSTFRYERK